MTMRGLMILPRGPREDPSYPVATRTISSVLFVEKEGITADRRSEPN